MWPVFLHGLMNGERIRWDEFEWRDITLVYKATIAFSLSILTLGFAVRRSGNTTPESALSYMVRHLSLLRWFETKCYQ